MSIFFLHSLQWPELSSRTPAAQVKQNILGSDRLLTPHRTAHRANKGHLTMAHVLCKPTLRDWCNATVATETMHRLSQVSLSQFSNIAIQSVSVSKRPMQIQTFYKAHADKISPG